MIILFWNTDRAHPTLRTAWKLGWNVKRGRFVPFVGKQEPLTHRTRQPVDVTTGSKSIRTNYNVSPCRMNRPIQHPCLPASWTTNQFPSRDVKYSIMLSTVICLTRYRPSSLVVAMVAKFRHLSGIFYIYRWLNPVVKVSRGVEVQAYHWHSKNQALCSALGQIHCIVSHRYKTGVSHTHNCTVIEHALRLNGIPCLRIDQKRNKQSAAKVFADDPNIRVLLLHGERENAGLNIVCASRVFLVESVVNHAFEVQGMTPALAAM